MRPAQVRIKVFDTGCRGRVGARALPRRRVDWFKENAIAAFAGALVLTGARSFYMCGGGGGPVENGIFFGL